MTPVTEWLALLRVHEGGVTTLEDGFLDHGRPVAGYVGTALRELIRSRHLALGRTVETGGRQVCVTHSGQLRYLELTGAGVGAVRLARR